MSSSCSSSILAVLDKISLGQTITVYFDSTFRTGKFQGIQNGNVVIVTTAAISVFIPLRKVIAVTF